MLETDIVSQVYLYALINMSYKPVLGYCGYFVFSRSIQTYIITSPPTARASVMLPVASVSLSVSQFVHAPGVSAKYSDN